MTFTPSESTRLAELKRQIDYQSGIVTYETKLLLSWQTEKEEIEKAARRRMGLWVRFWAWVGIEDVTEESK